MYDDYDEVDESIYTEIDDDYDYEEPDDDGLDEPDEDIDGEETFIPDEDLGAADTTEPDEYPPPIYPNLLTDLNSPIGQVVVQPGGAIYVNVELDFEDLIGVSSYEVRVTPK